MTNHETLTQSSPLHLMLKATDEIAMWERILRDAVVRARGEGISWADIATVLGVSKQAAQQRFAKDVPTEYVEDWTAVESEGKVVYWRRRRTDKSRLSVTKEGDVWTWCHRDANHEIKAEGTAKLFGGAKRAAEKAVG